MGPFGRTGGERREASRCNGAGRYKLRARQGKAKKGKFGSGGDERQPNTMVIYDDMLGVRWGREGAERGEEEEEGEAKVCKGDGAIEMAWCRGK